MLDNQTPSVPVQKVSDYELSDYRVKLYRKDLSRPIIYPLKLVGLWNVGLLGIGLQAFTVFNFTKIENLVLIRFLLFSFRNLIIVEYCITLIRFSLS